MSTEIDPPEITQAEALAGLRLNEGYQILLSRFEDEIKATEASMWEVGDGREGLRLLRYWQMIQRVLAILINEPEKAREELEKLRADAPQHEEIDFLSPRWAQPV